MVMGLLGKNTGVTCLIGPLGRKRDNPSWDNTIGQVEQSGILVKDDFYAIAVVAYYN